MEGTQYSNLKHLNEADCWIEIYLHTFRMTNFSFDI